MLVYPVTEYLKWKSSISGSVVHSPKVNRRPVLTWSSLEDDRTNHRPATSLLLKSDSVDRDEVFQNSEETAVSHAAHPVRPNTPQNPSPRVRNHGSFVSRAIFNSSLDLISSFSFWSCIDLIGCLTKKYGIVIPQLD